MTLPHIPTASSTHTKIQNIIIIVKENILVFLLFIFWIIKLASKLKLKSIIADKKKSERFQLI